ncbi:L,D-transpeptidase [Acidicapsa acidisoli]|uniref:L,D-transpeptidase n=1 Tax=Acidicapsa acidisoli TaxID=1615681 RepID=UPI0021E0D6A2|nr:L,D-transpeptidase [Acidicapsa acidisoli]
MKNWILKSLWIAVPAIVMAVQTTAQQAPAPEPVRQIVVSLADRKLALLEHGQVKKIYNVAVGKPSTPSPEGTFTIERRVVNPVYHHNGRTVEPGPANPVGTRWMGLSTKGYGIHGTNEPNSIGKAASHGCIRMAKADLEEFYGLVAVGDQVQIIGTRDEQTARLFEPAPAMVAKQAVQVAKAEHPVAAPVTGQQVSISEAVVQDASHHEPVMIAVSAAASR